MSDDFQDSVIEMLASNISIDASSAIGMLRTGEPVRDWAAEKVVHRAILAALEAYRSQMAVPRSGNMTFEQAMDAVLGGEMVARPSWGILRALLDGGIDLPCGGFRHRGHAIEDYKLDNLEGGMSGSGSSLFDPAADDVAATDWMIYQRPESFDVCLGD